MVGMFDVAHCGSCGSCLPACILGHAELLENVCGSGAGPWNWTYTDNANPELRKWSTSNVLNLLHSTIGSGAYPWKITSVIECTPPEVPGEYAHFGLAGGILDCNNFFYVELRYWYTVGGGPGGADSIWSQLRIVHVNAGVINLLVETPYAFMTGITKRGLAKLDFCYDGNKLHGEARIFFDAHSDTGVHDQHNLSTAGGIICPGDKMGIFTGLNLPTSVPAVFSNIKLQLSHGADTLICASCTRACCGGPPPAILEVKITGSSDAELCTNVKPCIDLDGTYPISHVNGDGICAWGGGPYSIDYLSFVAGDWVTVTMDDIYISFIYGTLTQLIFYRAGSLIPCVGAVLARWETSNAPLLCEDWIEFFDVFNYNGILNCGQPAYGITAQVKIM